MNFLLHPLAAMLLLLVVALFLFVPTLRTGMGNGLTSLLEAIVGKPNRIVYAGRRSGVKTGAVSAQGSILAISTDGGTTFIDIEGMTDVVDPAGEASDLDATNLKSTRKEYIAGLEDAQSVTINGQRMATDPGQQALLAAVGTVASFKQTLSNGEIQEFDAVVKKFGITGSVDGILMCACSLRATGDLTYSGTGHTT